MEIKAIDIYILPFAFFPIIVVRTLNMRSTLLTMFKVYNTVLSTTDTMQCCTENLLNLITFITETSYLLNNNTPFLSPLYRLFLSLLSFCPFRFQLLLWHTEI